VAKKVAPYEEILEKHKADAAPSQSKSHNAVTKPRASASASSADVFAQKTFEQMNLHPKLFKVLTDKGHSSSFSVICLLYLWFSSVDLCFADHLGLGKPTLIQARSTPILTQKRDAFIKVHRIAS